MYYRLVLSELNLIPQKEMVEWIDALKPSTLLHQDNDIIVHLEERIHKYQYANSMAIEKGLESLPTIPANN